VYLASLKDGGSKGTRAAHTLVVYVTNILLTDSYIISWVFDIGLVVHICNMI